METFLERECHNSSLIEGMHYATGMLLMLSRSATPIRVTSDDFRG